MTLDTFINSVTEQLTEKLPQGTTITSRRVAKNNNTVLDGLVITRANETLSPTIYLNEYFDACTQKNVPFDDLVNEILAQYYRCSPKMKSDFGHLLDYDKIKGDIIFRLVNYEKNKPLLTTMPHIPFLDLAVTFLCLVSVNEDNDAIISLKNEHLKLWDMTTEDLFSYTMRNTPERLPFVLQNITELIPSPLTSDEPLFPSADNISCPMYVLTNSLRMHGAGCLLYEGLMAKCAKKIGGSFIILPSSIHELLLIPRFESPDPEDLNAMVCEVNHDCVAADEYLSDHIYYYSAEDDTISCQ